MEDPYNKHVDLLETNLAKYARHSFEPWSPMFLDGGEAYRHFSRQWENDKTKSRLFKRTPCQIERDRIIHSPISRKLTEKYQVLYDGQRKVIRNYATHVNRLVQVTRAICRWLNLNSDFAEAIALGSKTGSLPFIHASKDAVSKWVQNKVDSIDKDAIKLDPRNKPPEIFGQLQLELKDASLPVWISSIRSPGVAEKVLKFLPWAAGQNLEHGFATGQQGYWMLATNPFINESIPNHFFPETMFGIWRHSLGLKHGPGSFRHMQNMKGAVGGLHSMDASHITYESIVVSFADDITWAIENLNDANTASLLNDRANGKFYELINALPSSDDTFNPLKTALLSDASAVYNYFISDFNTFSEGVLRKLGDGSFDRIALREGKSDACIGLSPEGATCLEKIKEFLDKEVFSQLRVKSRTQMLKTISEACMDILYQGDKDILPKIVRDKARVNKWPKEKSEEAENLIRDPIHRIQLVVDVFCEMGDQEIYELVGIDSL